MLIFVYYISIGIKSELFYKFVVLIKLMYYATH